MSCEWLSRLDYNRMDQRIGAVDLVIGCSDHIVNLVRERFPHHSHKCITAYNGVDVDTFGKSRGDDPPGDPDTVVAFVGRLSPEKGIHDLIQAFLLIADDHPGARLELIGPAGAVAEDFIVGISNDALIASLDDFYQGDYFQQLVAMVPPRLENRVVFRGGLPHAEVAELLVQADMLVNPSYVEAFGMPLVEAMASSLPVVATRTGGMVEIVDDGYTGFLVDRGDVAQLANAISRLLRERDLRRSMGAAGRIRAEELFSWNNISRALRCEYDRLTATLS
jgi:glycosyltransferase involved in cell wall biosynthesis